MPNIQIRIVDDCHKVFRIWNALLKQKSSVPRIHLHKLAGTLGAMEFLNKMHLHYNKSMFFSSQTLEKDRQKINIGLQAALSQVRLFDTARNTRRSKCDIDVGYNLTRKLYKEKYSDSWLAPRREMTKMCQNPSTTNQNWKQLNRLIVKELSSVVH